MSLAKCKDGVILVYPYTFANLQADNPHSKYDDRDVVTLFPKTEEGLAGAVLIEVVKVPAPVVNGVTHQVTSAMPAFVEGILTQQWVVTAYDASTVAANLEAERLRLCEEVKKIRDIKAVTSGWKVVVGGVDKWFHSDLFSRSQHQANARKADRVEMLEGDMDAPFPDPNNPAQPLRWKTMDKTVVALTPNVAQMLMESAEKQEAGIFMRSEVLQYMLMNYPDPYAVDLNSGWPVGYTPAAPSEE